MQGSSFYLRLVALATLSCAGGAKTPQQNGAGIKDQREDAGMSYDLMRNENINTHGTRLFRQRSALHVRHGLDLHLALQPRERCGDKSFTFVLTEEAEERPAVTAFTWTQRPSFEDQGKLHFRFHVNRNIPVGMYALHAADSCEKQDNGEKKTKRLGDVFVMFNPREAEGNRDRFKRQTAPGTQKDEYIDNNQGYLWIGNGAIPWNYAVGSQAVTDATKALMQMMSSEERSNMVLYSRRMSELVGNNVVRGRWDGRYDDGMDPTQWVGSEAILSHWVKNKRPVRYGQCWVFAAVLTTVLRASGIPARSVTNYESHHDRGLTDDGTAVLRQYDNVVQDDESTWNFHVWSEAWLARPDLSQPTEWNAVDATPQEPSPLAPGEPYRAGPAYVPYIKADMRNTDYDAYFILAEVNAQKRCLETGKLLPSAVGKAVVTKKPGKERGVYNSNNPLVITSNYKIKSALKRATEEDTSLIIPPPHVGCERDEGMRLNSVPPQPMVGEDFTLVVTEGNVSVEDTVVHMELMNYMGETLATIRNFTGVVEVNVTETDYLQYLRNSSVFKFTLGTYNESGDFEFHDDLRIRLEYEAVEVEIDGDSGSSNTINVTVTYTNPLSIPMTGVVVSISSPDHTYMRLEQPNIAVNSTFTLTVAVECGEDDGDVLIPVSLDSDETQSAYGMGWYRCGGGSSNGAGGTTMPAMYMYMYAVVLVIFSWTVYCV